MTTMHPENLYDMEVTITSDFKVVVVSPTSWSGTVLSCPPKIANGLPRGHNSRVRVDVSQAAVVELVQNRVEERRQDEREAAEYRKKAAAQTVHNLGPYAEFADSAYGHYRGTADEARQSIKDLLEAWDFEVSSAHEDYTFSLDIDPPAAEHRLDGDTQDNWTIGGQIEWSGDDATGLRIWHYGPSTARY